jgi:hypothetical protein
MKPHPRIRNATKWVATVAASLLATGVLISFFRDFGVRWYMDNMVDCMIRDGQVQWFEGFGPCPYGRSIEWERRRPFFFMGDRSILPRWYHFGSGITVTVPLWLPLAASIAFAVWLWRLDVLARRHARLNLCPKCNYDRAGIAADAKCPECGAIPTSRGFRSCWWPAA